MPEPADAQARLRQWLGTSALAGLRLRLRQACAKADPGRPPGRLRLGGLEPHEAEALQALIGRPPRPVRSLNLDLAELEERLRAAGLAPSLRAALETLDGPIVDRHEREATAAAWAALAREALHPALQAWLAQPRALGLLKRLSRGELPTAQSLCERAARVLQALPAGGVPRARLAATCLGDAHALDDGQALATVVLGTLRQGLAEAEGAAEADTARSLWARQGVAVNELARPALSLNLSAAGTAAPPGEPQYWSLRRLLRQPPAWAVASRDVYVCENPNLLALAADALGPRCAPLVCTDGMPAAAQRSLLQQLAAAGARLHYHGDFDWPGLAIGNQLMGGFGARPWRFGQRDYEAALAEPGRARVALSGIAVAAHWDSSLAPAMHAANCAVPEEALFETLRGDLEA